jgi:hypothetical protein
MKGFVLGLLVAALAFAGYLYWKEQRNPPAPRVASGADAGAPGKKKRRRGRGAARVRVASDEGSEPEPEPVKLSAADLKSVGQGDDLSRPDVVRMDMSDDKDSRELTQEDIDATFRARESDILGCISSARPDPESYVSGRVTVKFRIQRAGSVRGVRVEAPAILQKGGLYDCVKKIVGGLHFPPSGGSQVVTYPFSLS